MSLEARHLTLRGQTYQFYLRVPKDLVSHYGAQFIRQSLRTKDQRVALSKLQPLIAHYQSEFERLRGNPNALPASLTTDAKELAKALVDNEDLASLLFDNRRAAYADNSEDPEHTYATAKPEDYLTPVEARALKMSQQGLDKPYLTDALELYFKLHEQGEEPRFRVFSEREWKRLLSFQGDVLCESITRSDARSFVDHLLSTGLKTGSVRRCLNTINAVLNTAFKEFEIHRNQPFKDTKIPGEGKDSKAAESPSPEQLRSVAAALNLQGSASHLIAAMMLETGPRIAEISGLKVADVVLDAAIPHLRIQPNEWLGLKTSCSEREVPLVGISLRAAQRAVELAGAHEALFPKYAHPEGNKVASAAVCKLLKPYGFTSHSFRHSLKDRLREVDCPKTLMDAIQGHENGDVADTYGKGFTLSKKHEWLLKSKVSE